MSEHTCQEWEAIDKQQRQLIDRIFAPENFAQLGTIEERVAWGRAHLAPPNPGVIGVIQGWNPSGGALW